MSSAALLTSSRGTEFEEILNNMVVIPAGNFTMGSTAGAIGESPVRDVYVDQFKMDWTLVTNAQFKSFVKDTGYKTTAEILGQAWGYSESEYKLIPGLCWRSCIGQRDNHPVVLVSHEDAQAFAAWIGKRLPTEAEWEKAARGGLANCLYPWGNAEPDGSQCNFAAAPAKVPPTTSVETFAPNGYGLFDMVGSVWQWCADWYSETSYNDCSHKAPKGAEIGTHRVRRGGAWNVIQSFRLRCSNRGAFDPRSCAPNLGFRCAANLPLDVR